MEDLLMATRHRDLTADERNALPKDARLLHDMTKAYDRAGQQAHRFKRRTILCWWASVMCAVVAIVSGFVAKVPQVQHLIKIEPWMLSAVTSIGAVIQVVQMKASWPAKSDEFHRHHEALRSLIYKAEYEISVSDDMAIASLSKEFRQENNQISENLHKIKYPEQKTNKT